MGGRGGAAPGPCERGEGGPVSAAEQAGKGETPVHVELIVHRSAFCHADEPARPHRYRDPDAALRVQADAIRRAVELRPHAAVGERSVGVHVERGQARGHGLGDDQRLAVGCDHHAVGKREIVSRNAGIAVGRDEDQAGVRSLVATAEEIEAEMANVGPALRVHDHVVAVEGGQPAHAGRLRPSGRTAGRLQTPPIDAGHGRHETTPRGEPARLRP